MIDQVISHYRIIEKLGGGGRGSSTRPRMSNSIALWRSNSFPMRSPKTSRLSARFQREAKAASALNHPNICTIYEIDDQHGQTFIAMEFLDGVTLEAFHRADKPLETEVLLEPGDRDRRCTRRSARARGSSSRYQAGEYLRHPARPCQNSGFRSGQGDAAKYREYKPELEARPSKKHCRRKST